MAAAAVRVEAGALSDLQLEELHEPHLFARARHVAQLPVRVGEHDPGFGDVEQLDATLRERLHEVDEVVLSTRVSASETSVSTRRSSCSIVPLSVE